MIQLINDDCLKAMDKLIEQSVKVDLIICDLPYGTTWAKWDSIIDFEAMWEKCEKICSGAVVLFSSQPFTTQLIYSNIKNFKYTWYWVKNNKGNYLNAKMQPMRQLEEVNVFYPHKYYPQGLIDYNKNRKRGSSAKTTMQNYSNEWLQEKTGYPSNVLHYDLDKDKFHPTQKPVSLIEYLIKTYTNENDLVLDFTMGSGTTGVACKNTNRNFIGIEMDENYFNIAKKRINNKIKESTLF